MSFNPFNRNLHTVTDPSDWQNTKLPNFSVFDSLQRCYICKEFLKAPVMTSCNHTFCSHCIREYLIVNSHCPLCKTEQFESNLKRDILLEEIVTCYSHFRPFLLGLLHGKDSSEDSSSTEITKETTTSRKRSPSEEVIEISSDEFSPNVGESPNKKHKLHLDDKYLNALPEKRDMVECPICSEIMPAEILQAKHIDDCLSGKKTTKFTNYKSAKRKTASKNGITSFFKPANERLTSSSSSFASRSVIPKLDHNDFYFNDVSKHVTETKKLPKLDFSSLTTPRLKEKLANLKLPMQGTRLQLELRYNHYYVLFNSNLDSNHPISDKILKQKLNQWELSHSAFNSSLASNLFDSNRNLSHKSITDKDFSPKEWQEVFYGEFRRLIKEAKRSIKKDKSSGNNKPKTNVTSHQKFPEQSSDSIYSRSSEPSIDSAVISDQLNDTNLHSSDSNFKSDQSNPTIDLDFKQAMTISPLFINQDDEV